MVVQNLVLHQTSNLFLNTSNDYSCMWGAYGTVDALETSQRAVVLYFIFFLRDTKLR